jgi:endonuclease/exonuclease/phosphatase (EEP) superfamily protein YafD
MLWLSGIGFPLRMIELSVVWIVAALVLLTTTAQLGRYNKYFELSCHFRVQYCLASGVCLPICLVLGRWWWAGGALLSLTINFSAIGPWFRKRKSGDEPRVGGRRFKLALYNVEWQNRAYGAFLASVERHQPDILVVQELSKEWVAAIVGLGNQYPFSEVLPREEGSGIALYSRIPFERLPLVVPEDDVRPGILICLDFAGRRVFLLSIHPRAPIRRGHFKLRNDVLAAAAERLEDLPEPKICVGDMNASLWTPFLQDATRRAGLTNVRKGFGILPSWPTFMIFKWLMLPIDHCLVSSDIRVLQVTTGEGIGSDHLPLLMELEVEGHGANVSKSELLSDSEHDVSEVRRKLLPAHCQPVDPNCRRGHAAAEFQVATNLGDIFEDVFQVSRDRNLFDWIGQFSIHNPLS